MQIGTQPGAGRLGPMHGATEHSSLTASTALIGKSFGDCCGPTAVAAGQELSVSSQSHLPACCT